MSYPTCVARKALGLSLLAGLAAGVAHAQTPVMIDVNPYSTTASNGLPAGFVKFGTKVLFSANDGVNGTELWISDGTEAGTVLLKDINPGSASGFPQNLTVFGSRVLFSAVTAGEGRELWITDGTEAGTVLVRDINPGTANASFSSAWAAVGSFGTPGSFVAFGANGGGTGVEPWITDGTSLGTVSLGEIRAGSSGSNASGYASDGTYAYFLANDGGSFGNELWRTTATTQERITDIAAGSASSGFSVDLIVNGWAYGSGATSGSDGEPTAVNLTTFEARRLADVRSGSNSSFPVDFVQLGSGVYFRANATGTDTQLYRVTFDGFGDPAGAALIVDINAGGNDSVGSIGVFNGKLYFTASGGAAGRELWTSDGTAPGTTQVLDLNPGAGESAPTDFRVSGGRLFFSAIGATTGRELYATDGTAGGTVFLGDLRLGAGNGIGSSPSLIDLDGTLLFGGSGTAVGTELFKSNGTEATTVLVKDILPSAISSGSVPQNLFFHNGLLYFSATDEAAGRELWASDGTQSGTVRIIDANPGSSASGSPATFTAFGTDVLCTMNGGVGAGGVGIEYWRISGTSAAVIADINPGTGSSAPGGTPTIAVLGGSAFFSATDGSSGAEVWTYDGTAASRLADFVPGSGGLSPGNFATVDGTVYFAGTTTGVGGFGNEPYRLAGSTITLLEDYNPGSSSGSFPAGYFGFGGKVAFRATAPSLGSELTAYDPVSGDVYLVADIRPGSSGSSPNNFIGYNGVLHFLATDGLSNLQLYSANLGTGAGTGSVTLRSGTPSFPTGGNVVGSTATTLVRSGDYLFFAGGVSVGTNVELWAYDGVANGGFAFPIEINPTGGSFPTDLTDVNGVLYFGAVGPTGGNELYRVTYDGSGLPNGAELVADLNPAGSGTPRNLRFADGKLWFTADNGISGEELWYIDIATCPCTPDYNQSGSDIADIDDLIKFFEDFAEGDSTPTSGDGDPSADINCTGEGSVPDIDDIVRFFEIFNNGC